MSLAQAILEVAEAEAEVERQDQHSRQKLEVAHLLVVHLEEATTR